MTLFDDNKETHNVGNFPWWTFWVLVTKLLLSALHAVIICYDSIVAGSPTFPFRNHLTLCYNSTFIIFYNLIYIYNLFF